MSPSAAMGLPDPANLGNLGKLQAGQLLDLIIQEHKAQRAGLHQDIRFGNPELGLYSWATRKGLPGPGSRHALFQQPLHAHAYGDFQGTLHGYGAGEVRRKRKGQILVTSAAPGKIEFTTADERYPQRYALVKPQTFGAKDWLLINNTPREPVPYQKVHYATIPAEQVEGELAKIQQGDSVQTKVDGASSLIKLLKDGVEVVSYRTSKGTGHPIVHTERIFHGKGKYTKPIPPELVGSVLKGELYGERIGAVPRPAVPAGSDGGHSAAQPARAGGNGATADAVGSAEGTAGPFGTDSVLGPQELGGLLNSTLAKSIAAQKEQKVKLRVMLHGIQQFGKQEVGPEDVPYEKRRRLLQAILPHLPAEHFHLPEEATDPAGAQALWKRIAAGEHPLTREGVVIHPRIGKPRKAKLTEEQDVHITGTFPGEGKYKDLGAGGFTYSLAPGGPTIGRVGTGLSDELRRDLHANPEFYTGRVARVRSQGPFSSGALRAPAFLALHEDYPVKEAMDATSFLSGLGMRHMTRPPRKKKPISEEYDRPQLRTARNLREAFKELGERQKVGVSLEELEELGIVKSSGAPSYLMQSLRTQMARPTWDMQRGLFHNLLANVGETFRRGQTFVDQARAVQDMQTTTSLARTQRLLQALRGIDPVVTHPVDQALFNRKPWP